MTVERQVTAETVPKPRKKHSGRAQPAAPAEPSFVNCDPNIQARAATTTCTFAENVFWSYWTSGQSDAAMSVWSPAAHASFETTCDSDGLRVVCTTSDNGEVRFSQGPLGRYSQAQADVFANAHDLGPDPYEGLPAPESDSGGDACQGYDPCITPGDDVDCAGGTGNGPRYVDGPVYVSGDDPYGLDANYDGVGCEY